jgi:hypothetical protein
MSAFLKNLLVKVLGGTCVYLSEAYSLPMTPYSPPETLYTVRVYSILIHNGKRGGGGVELTRERGAMLHKAGRKYQHD